MSLGIFVHDFNIVKPDGTVALKSSATPTQQEHLASKQYVDTAVAEGGGDWFASVENVLATPPGSPSNGDRHLVAGSGASGAWAGKENQVAQYETSSTTWIFTSPTVGSHVYVEGGSTFAGNTIIYVADTGGGSPGWVVLGNASGALLKSNNLSELTGTAGTARTNLGLGSLSTKSSLDLAGDVGSTILPVANGGTGASAAPMIGIVTAADAAAVKTILAIGSIASQSASNVAITGGSITGITDLAIADGGTGASSASDARTNLGLGTAAVLDSGTAINNLVKLDKALAANELLGLKQDSAINVTSATNLNYLYSGGSWEVKDGSSNVVATGSVVDIDSTNTRVFVSYTTGSSYSVSAGFTFHASGYQWTTGSTPTANVNRLRGLNAASVKEVIGDAQTSSQASGATKGVAAFDSGTFQASSGFISLATGLTRGKAPTFLASVAIGDIVKAASFSNSASGNFISSGAIDASAKTVKTQVSAVANIVAGQTMSSSGYDFEVVSVSSDGQSTPTFTITVLDPSSNLQYLYNSGTFEIFSGSGFISAGAYGTAANEAIATALSGSGGKVLKVASSDLASGDVLSVDSSANVVAKTLGTAADEDVATALNATNGKLLKVASAANLTNNQLLKINSSGEIEGTTEAGTGTVTSIALQDDDGDSTTAITSSGAIAVVGDGTVITTNVNSSNQLEIAVAAASASQSGVVQFASSSNYSGGANPATLNLSSGADLGAGKVFTLNSSAQWETKELDGFDLSGPIVQTCGGIETAAPSMPSAAGDLKGVYSLDLSSLSADASITLPKITAAGERGITTTIKVLAMAVGRKITVHAPVVTGGGKMLIDGFESIDLSAAGQSLTVHYSDFMSDSASSNATRLSMI